MQVAPLRLAGLKKVSPDLFADERGLFLESYQRARYFESEIALDFVQDNLVLSKKGVLRGLHFQSHPGQAKLVSCLQGEIWDVAVDVRPDSATFMQWEACYLDGDKHEQFFIPVGFAHGYLVISETALVHYKVSAAYDPATEKSIRWNDPDLAISWGVKEPSLSERDQKSPFFKEVCACLFG